MGQTPSFCDKCSSCNIDNNDNEKKLTASRDLFVVLEADTFEEESSLAERIDAEVQAEFLASRAAEDQVDRNSCARCPTPNIDARVFKEIPANSADGEEEKARNLATDGLLMLALSSSCSADDTEVEVDVAENEDDIFIGKCTLERVFEKATTSSNGTGAIVGTALSLAATPNNTPIKHDMSRSNGSTASRNRGSGRKIMSPGEGGYKFKVDVMSPLKGKGMNGWRSKSADRS